MPTVPTLQGQQVQERGVPGVRLGGQADPTAFGGAVAGSLSRASGQLANISIEQNRIRQQEQQKADEIAFMDADNRMSEFINTSLNDPDTGALNQQGKLAAAVYPEVINGFDKQAGDIESSLTTAEQKQMFRQQVMSRRVKFNNQLMVHVSDQMQRYDAETTNAYIGNRRNDAVSDYMNPHGVKNQIKAIRSAIVTHADRTGKPAEWVDAAITDEVGRTHLAVIDRMLSNGLDQAAGEYYQSNKMAIPGDRRDAIEKGIASTGIISKSQALEDQLMSMGKNEAATLAMAREKTDGAVRDDLVKRIKTRFIEQDAAIEQANRKMFEDSYNKIANTGNTDSIPRLTWNEMSPAQQKSLEQHARNVVENKKPVMTDELWTKFNDLRDEAINPAKQETFAKYNLVEIRPSMPDKEWRELVDLQQSVRGALYGGGDGGKKMFSLQSNSAIANDTFNLAVGMDTNGKIKTDPATRDLRNRFTRSVNQEIRARQDRGEVITPEVVQKVSDEMLIVSHKDLTWWQWTKDFIPYVNYPDKFLMDVTVNDIPAEDMTKIRNEFESKGIANPSQQQILDYYKNYKAWQVTKGTLNGQ